jgi:hypothetical protein
MKQFENFVAFDFPIIGLPPDGDVGFGQRVARSGTGGEYGAEEGKE